MFDRILCLGAHTDDIEIGCGGSVVRFIKEGKDVYYASFSFAEQSLPDGFSNDSTQKEVKKATSVLGIESSNVMFFDYPVRYFTQYRQEILEDLVGLKKEIKPDLLLTHNTNDMHQDHEVICKESFRAFKQTSSVFGYESLKNNTQFSTDVYIILTDEYIRKKIKAARCYKSQMAKENNTIGVIESVASFRGAQVKASYAESFELIRLIME